MSFFARSKNTESCILFHWTLSNQRPATWTADVYRVLVGVEMSCCDCPTSAFPLWARNARKLQRLCGRQMALWSFSIYGPPTTLSAGIGNLLCTVLWLKYALSIYGVNRERLVVYLLLLLGFWWRELGGPCSRGALPSDIPQIPVSVQAGVGSQTRFRPGFVPRKMCHLAVLILHRSQDCQSIICI